MTSKQDCFQPATFILLCFMFSACTTPAMKIDTDRASSTTFNNLKSYSWMSKPVTGEPRIDNDNDFHKSLQRAIDDQLHAKGFIKKPQAKGDFLITYTGELRKISDTKPWSSQYRPGLTLGAPATVNYVYEEGSLTVKFLDPDSKEIIWQGSAMDRIKSYTKSDKDRKQLNEAIRKILADIPNA